MRSPWRTPLQTLPSISDLHLSDLHLPRPGAEGAVPRDLVKHVSTLVLAAAMLLVAVVGLLTWGQFKSVGQGRTLVRHTTEVMTITGELGNALRDAEIGQCGFLLTGQDSYLAPYHDALDRIVLRQADLLRLTADNPVQQSQLRALAPIVERKLEELAQTIRIRREVGSEAALAAVQTDSGFRLMGQIEAILRDMFAEEERLLRFRRDATDRAEANASWLALGGTALAVGLLAFCPRLLARSRRKLQDLLATLNLGTLMARDLDGTIRFWSEGCARLYGWTAAEAVGRNAHELLCTDHPTPLAELEAALLRSGEWTGDLLQRARDGREVVVTARTMLRHAVGGQPSAVLESLADVSAQHQTHARLRESEARLQVLQSELLHVSRLSDMGQMAATLAHELNQPLTAIVSALRGALRMLQAVTPAGSDGAVVPPRVLEAVDRAAAQSLRAGQIVRRLREFVAKSEVETRVEDLRQLVKEAGTLALLGTKSRGIAVSFRFAPGLPSVLVDRIQIQQVLINLIRNAIEAMSDEESQAGSTHRELVVTAVPAGPDMVEVSVADTGPGLAPEIAEHLFEAFVTNKVMGMGIGLSISRSIVEAYGGRIWTEPNAGGGTVFRFTLRAAHEAEHSEHNE